MIAHHVLKPDTQFLNLVELLQWRAQHQPDQTAYTFLVDGETEAIHLTYAELDAQARALAMHLQSLADYGERALLLYPQGLDFITAFFACLYAGIVAVPAYPPRRNQTAVRLQSIVADAQAKIVLTTADILATMAPRFDEAADLAALNWVTSDRLPTAPAIEWQPPLIQPHTLAFLQYTSGSTGTPKGVMVNHRNILHNSECIKQSFELSAASVSVTWLPSFHDMGLIDGIIQPLYTGFLGVLMPPAAFMQKPIRWLQAIAHYGATHSGGPNLGYELCTQKITPEQQQTLDLSQWSSAYSGAEPVRRQTLEAFTAKFATCGFEPQSFYPCYGMAEATLMITGGTVNQTPVYCAVQADELAQNRIVETVDPENVRHLVGCGHSWGDTRLEIVDLATSKPCLSGQVGEIWLAGDSVAQGYWQRPEQTQATFHAALADTAAGPFLRTGDLGFLHGDELFITGRIKDLIILWGRNHYPQDIEATVSQSHPALRPECGAAFSVEIDGAERLVIVQEVERTYLRQLNLDEIVTAVRQAVSEQHDVSVHAVVLLKTASIPKTSSGKIQRYACRAGFLAGQLNVVGESRLSIPTPKNDSIPLPHEVENDGSQGGAAANQLVVTEYSIQDWLIDRLAEILQLDPDDIDLEEPFSIYGLDSSVAMSLTGELAEWLGCELEPTLFWEYPNITELVRYLWQKTNK
ncbi:AMP-binding protein [filamentous cyanobacterium LEGE 11480]|uniref:AMP-binding protein n=1 Tax=Romeriopsis navalis LEGE 11480 TaxID=2777977 RepID=A0A928Z182_9CYAN|nr:AMP-binding protein [Romeriopsis navalis]MBE9029056.1 AMP-binding protein [Romeriopsis navalis LEGE 11480]